MINTSELNSQIRKHISTHKINVVVAEEAIIVSARIVEHSKFGKHVNSTIASLPTSPNASEDVDKLIKLYNSHFMCVFGVEARKIQDRYDAAIAATADEHMKSLAAI